MEYLKWESNVMAQRLFLFCLVGGVFLFVALGASAQPQLRVSGSTAPVGPFIPTPPLGASISKMVGNQLIVRKRHKQGGLSAPSALKLRGVSYSPVDIGEQVLSSVDARTHLINSLYPTDFPLIKAMNANAIKTYIDMGTGASAQQFLDAAYANGLWVMVTVFPDAAHLSGEPTVTSVINAYKDHPALLGWIIGNEWNLNLFYSYSSSTLAGQDVEAAAQLIKSLDPNHIVASSLGLTIDNLNLDWTLTGTMGPLLSLAPSIDLWGFNVYRATDFAPWNHGWNEIGGDAPYFFSEYGTDGYQATNVSSGAGTINETLQATTDKSLWNQIHRNLSASDPQKKCVGGFVFEFNDEYWKAPNGSPYSQEYSGFNLSLSYPDIHLGGGAQAGKLIGHPDSYSNEEYYGVVRINRTPKLAYTALQDAYSLGWNEEKMISVAAYSQGSNSDSFYWMAKNDELFAFRYGYVQWGSLLAPSWGRGFNVAIIDRSTGAISALNNFDTWQLPASFLCPLLSNMLSQAKPGDIVMAAGNDTVNPAYSPQCTALQNTGLSQCLSEFQTLGSNLFGSLYFSQPWAFIAEVGNPIGTVLAEGSGSGTCPPIYNPFPYVDVQVSTSFYLDFDRDGITDNLDNDDDNDGVSDTLEKLNGTDVLDAGSF